MSSLHATVADFYRYVVGVDTHAATHSYAIVAAPNGALVDQATFPATPAGLRRARDWIGRRTDGDLDGVLISAESTGSYGAVLGDVLAEAGYCVVEAPTPRRDRGRGKTDALDAVLAARSTLAMTLPDLRDRRAGDAHTAVQVLTGARDQLNADRLHCINALTALVRGHDLGLDARRALTSQQIATIAGWRRRDEPLGVATARAEAVRLAKRIIVLDEELASNRHDITALVEAQAPELLDLPGVAAITAAIVLTVWSHPGRIRSEAAFAQIAGTYPIPASSGNTVRHRLNRGGDRRLNRAINTVVLTRMRTDPDTRTYIERRLSQGKTRKEIRRCLERYVSRQIFRTLAAAHQESSEKIASATRRRRRERSGCIATGSLKAISPSSAPAARWASCWGSIRPRRGTGSAARTAPRRGRPVAVELGSRSSRRKPGCVGRTRGCVGPTTA